MLNKTEKFTLAEQEFGLERALCDGSLFLLLRVVCKNMKKNVKCKVNFCHRVLFLVKINK